MLLTLIGAVHTDTTVL